MFVLYCCHLMEVENTFVCVHTYIHIYYMYMPEYVRMNITKYECTYVTVHKHNTYICVHLHAHIYMCVQIFQICVV